MSPSSTSFEDSCQLFLQDMLLLNQGDTLLIYIDRADDEVVARDIQAHAETAGIATDIVQLRQWSSATDRADALCEKITAGDFTAVCELSDQYFYLTPVWGQAMRKGCRLFSIGSMDKASFIRCIGEVDREKLAALGEALHQLIEGARHVQLETDAGTSIHFRMNTNSLAGRIMTKLRLSAMSQVWSPTGTLRQGGSATFLGGQLSFLPMPHTIKGTAVIDGVVYPPTEIGCLDEPIVLEIDRGHVTSIGDKSGKSTILDEWLSGQERAIEHFCIGFNPGAQICDNMVEAERAFGHINIGLGKYPYHTDGVIRAPKLTIDGVVLMDKNCFVHPKIVGLAKALQRDDS
jgi:leucyl aminopeptidase (aminopeptidase T)